MTSHSDVYHATASQEAHFPALLTHVFLYERI